MSYLAVYSIAWWNCYVLCFTVTWLNPGILDSAIQPGGGHCVPGNGTSTCRARWTWWWCSSALASSSCWSWRSRRRVAATSSSSPSCSSSGFAGRRRTSPTSWSSKGHPCRLIWVATHHPWGHRLSHHEHRLPGVHFSPCCGREEDAGYTRQDWEAQEELLPSGH